MSRNREIPLRKPEIDDEVVELLRPALGRAVSKRKVSLITTTFLYAVLHGIAEREAVVIKGFGTFRRRWNGRTLTVTFTPTKFLAPLIKMQGEPDMEKYAVEENPPAEDKLAGEGCPKCGKPLIEQGKVRLCPVHGSEPFEAVEPKR